MILPSHLKLSYYAVYLVQTHFSTRAQTVYILLRYDSGFVHTCSVFIIIFHMPFVSKYKYFKDILNIVNLDVKNLESDKDISNRIEVL